MQLSDRAMVAGTRRREDGSFLADVRIARTGIQVYRGDEVGKSKDEWVKVYRPGEEVFSKDTMASATHRPVTNDHPPELVDVQNWKKYAVGNTADEVSAEGIYIRVPMMVSDAKAIQDIDDGKRELSAGYTCELDWTPGVTKNGEKYDAVQRNIRLNHVAIVDAGRAGSEVRIGDGAAAWGSPPNHLADRKEPAMETRTVMVDGLSVNTTDQGAQAIDKLIKEREDARKALTDAATAHQTALAAKDGELAKKDATIDELQGKILDGGALDKLVADRATLISQASKLWADGKFDGKSNADIKKAVLTHKLGGAALEGKSDAYLDARFDAMIDTLDSDTTFESRDGHQQQQHQDKQPTGGDQAYQAMLDRNARAWNGDNGKAN